MKELLLNQARHNEWANQRIAKTLLQLSQDQLDQTLVSSFDTIRLTVYHLWNGESVWYQRIQLADPVIYPQIGYDGTFEDAVKAWVEQSGRYVSFIETASQAKLEHTYGYYDREQRYFKLGVITTLQQVFSHGAYHRGQLVTMMRQVGIQKIPGTDYVLFARTAKI